MYIYRTKESDEYVHKIVVPRSLRAKVLAIAHLAHQGLDKTYQFVSAKYFWFGIYSDTLNFVYSCDKCIKAKPYTSQKAPFGSNWIPDRPAQFISMDILGPLNNGQYVLTIIDHFTRHLELYPLARITTEAVTKHVFDYIASYGRPSMILTDLGTQFCSETFEKINETLGIKLMHTSSGRPQCNAVSERVNLGIKTTILSLMQEGHSFVNALNIHKNLYNGSVHSSTGFTPNQLHFGRHLSLIFDTFQPDLQPTQIDKTQYLAGVLASLNECYQKCFSNLERRQLQQNNRQEANAKVRNLRVNDIVYLRSRDKFKPKYTGPYTITKKCNSRNYLIRVDGDPQARQFRIHVDRLRVAPKRKEYLEHSGLRDGRNQGSVRSTGYNLRSRQ